MWWWRDVSGGSCFNNVTTNLGALTANVGIAVGRCFAPGDARRCPRGHGAALRVSPHFHKHLIFIHSRGRTCGYINYALYRGSYPGSAVGVRARVMRSPRANGGGHGLISCRCSLNSYVFYRLYIGTYGFNTVGFIGSFRGTIFSHGGLIVRLSGRMCGNNDLPGLVRNNTSLRVNGFGAGAGWKKL